VPENQRFLDNDGIQPFIWTAGVYNGLSRYQ